MIIDCLSDLHGHYPKLEGGDLLIVAGDLTAGHSREDFYQFANWMRNQKYEDRIVIAGNHDTWIVEEDYWHIENWYDIGEFEFLCDNGTELENGLKIWGSPWTKTFEGMNPDYKAFTCDTEEQLAEKWALIPDDIDILVTHSPPYGILDKINRDYSLSTEDIIDELLDNSLHVGSTSLNYWMRNKWKFFGSSKISIFGHIHEHGGKTSSLNMIQFINCSLVNERYEPVNKPIRVIL